MKQTITVRDPYSKNLHDAVSSDLKGYVEVNVTNKKTGEIEHQENHNLIVYCGREWLLRKLFESSITNNNVANTSIKWVGFGCGGGEAGNPLQTGTTLGSDNDLYQPVRIRFNDEQNTTNANQYYASRVLPNGSVIPGYYKQLSSVTLKEDHANPYIENNIKKYPTLIAEIRVELSSDDCNGENYSENGNLTAYQDINEAALFISDNTVTDPGTDVGFQEKFTDVTGSNKVYHQDGLTRTQTDDSTSQITYHSNTNTWDIDDSLSYNSYILQVKNGDTWTTISTRSHVFEDGKLLQIRRNSDTGVFSYYVNSGAAGAQYEEVSIPEWAYTSSTSPHLRLVSCGLYELTYENYLTNSDGKNCYCELQYRNDFNAPWTILSTRTLRSTGESVTETYAVNGTSVPGISSLSMFRTRQTVNQAETIHIQSIESDPEETSYEVKCYVSDTDIQKVIAGQYIYTDSDTQLGNTIHRSAPIKVLSVFNRVSAYPDTYQNYHSYFVVERDHTTTGTYTGTGLGAYVYKSVDTNPYTMFSRVTLSSIRKSQDREIVIVWKIYV